MTTPIIACVQCGQPIQTFAQWFSEPCPQEVSQHPGHVLTWRQIMRLQFQAHPEKKEVLND